MNKKKYYKELFYLIRKLRVNENSCSHSMTKGVGGILYELSKNPTSVTPGELSERLAVGSGRIGNALKSMEEKGVIERKAAQLLLRRLIAYLFLLFDFVLIFQFYNIYIFL